MAQLPEFMTVPEVAEVLRMGAQGVRRAIRAGRLPARKVGRGYLITSEDLRAYLDSLPTTPVDAAPVELAGGRVLAARQLSSPAVSERWEQHSGEERDFRIIG